MERPKKISGEQGEYIEFLEGQLDIFKSKRTKVRTYLTLKKIVDDINSLVNRGLEIDDPNNPGNKFHVDIISESALTDKDEKTFERIFKVLEKAYEWSKQIEEIESELTDGEIDKEKELLKGDLSVESYIMRSNG
jgi:hypothetical protein